MPTRDKESVNINVYADQREWADNQNINLSGLVRDLLDDERERRG